MGLKQNDEPTIEEKHSKEETAGMGSKKQIVVVVLLAAILGGGVLGYSWQRNKTGASTFSVAGYVHVADPERDVKQIAFQGGTAWRRSLADTVSFADTQGNRQKVSTDSFVHYDDQALAALDRGVVVDLNDLDTTQMTNHYSVAPAVAMEKAGNGYAFQGASENLSMSDFLWKLNEGKYMLVSSNIECRFSEDDVRPVEDYMEITYIDEGVIQIQSRENVWQTVSDSCVAVLNNGEVVDLSLRNVQNSSGDVLMDFSKMVVDADSNVEVTPLTQELAEVHESIIPHFDITAKDGEDGEQGVSGAPGEAGLPGDPGTPGEAGEAGDAGESGEAGEAGEPGTDGQQGTAGTAGASGAAGASGTNGAPGNPGAPGTPGNAGEAPTPPTSEVLALPEFTIEDWLPTATGCSGVIKVKDPKNLLLTNSGELTSRVYIMDPVTGTTYDVNDGNAFEFSSLNADGYSFSYSGLKPDHEYVLMVDAPIDTGSIASAGSGPYVRNFITKVFYTDSVGVYMEAEPSTTGSVTLAVRARNYSGTVSNVTVYLYASQTQAAAATAADPGSHISQYEAQDFSENNAAGVRFGNESEALKSNTTFYARVVATVGTGSDATTMMPAQILPLTTLKKEVELGAPIMTPNRTSWGFDVTPMGIRDEDSGVTGYRYEFYETDQNGDADTTKFVKSVETKSTSGLTIPLDYVSDSGATGLKAGERYVVRLVATFNDNEKTYDVYSGFSNAAMVTGGALPNVTYQNANGEGAGGSGVGTGASDESGWYDQLNGTVRVFPANGDSSKLMLGSGHVPRVTIRASGYYYVQYPVYPEGSVPLDADSGKYLTGTTQTDGTVEISISERVLKDLKDGDNTTAAGQKPGNVNGLRAGTAYRIIVSGDLTRDGTNVEDENVTVGVCVVNTPALEQVKTTLSYNGQSDDRNTLKDSKLALFTLKTGEQELTTQLKRQQATLTGLKLEALDSAGSSTPLATVELTEKGYKDLLGNPATYSSLGNTEKTQFAQTLSDAGSLGELMEKGLPLTESLFQTNLDSFSVTNLSALFVKVSAVVDYTDLTPNRTNQNSYKPLDSVDPDDNKTEYSSFYTNKYTLVNNPDALEQGRKAATTTDLAEGFELIYDIQLGATPDPIPDPGKGITVERKDTDGDGYRDDAYLLTPQYANGGKLARWITFYVFDAPDWNITEEGIWTSGSWNTNGYQFNGDDFGNTWPTKYMTPVTAVDTTGNGLWLAKLRVPVPSTGAFANQMPKVEFIPQTAEDYFGCTNGNHTTECNIYTNSLRPGSMSRDNPPADNTWKIFYKDGSTEPRTGHQFVFAWTMEYEITDGGVETTKYYPFEYSGYTAASGNGNTGYGDGFYKRIPHSAVIDAPHRNPTVFAKPWSTKFQKEDSVDPTNVADTVATDQDGAPVVTWKLFVSDPDRAVVLEDAAAAAPVARLWRRQGAGEQELHSGPQQDAPPPTVPVSFDKLPDRTAPAAAHEAKILVQNDEATAFNVGLRVQLYTNKYNLRQSESLFADGNGYRDSTKKNAGSVSTSVTAFLLDYRRSSFLWYSKVENGAGTGDNLLDKLKEGASLEIDKIVDSGTVNRYSVTVFAGNFLNKINGVRLTFTPESGSPVVLDKYVECEVDSYGSNWVEDGKIQFAVDVPRELGGVAGQKVTLKAEIIYEDGHVGYSYANQPVSLTSTESLNSQLQERWHIYRGTPTPLLTQTDTNSQVPRLGSFFTMTPVGSGEWPSSWTVRSTRTALWEMQNWKPENLDVYYTGGVRYVPRKLGFQPITQDKVTGTALEYNTTSSKWEIAIPNTVPVITYSSPEQSANSIKTGFSVNQTVNNNEVYFTLERQGENGAYNLLQYEKDRNGVYTWTDSERTTDDIGSLAQGGGSDFFITVPYITKDQKSEVDFQGLAADKTYRIRAWYWDTDDHQYKLMNMTQSGSSALTSNYQDFLTESVPDVNFQARYRVSGGYDYKWIETRVAVPRLLSYYYTLELQDASGKFITYLDTISNRTPDRNGIEWDRYFVGYKTPPSDLTGSDLSVGSHGFVTTDNSFMFTGNGQSAYPILDKSTKRCYLNYGQMYRVQVRVYSIGQGPAYDGGTGADLLSQADDSKKIKTFTVLDTDDTMPVSCSFDLKTVTSDATTSYKPTAYFALNPTTRSGRLRPYVTPVVVLARTQNGQTTYSDVTNEVTKSVLTGGDTSWGSYQLLNLSRQTLELDLSGGGYKQGDEIYFFLYGILDNADGTTAPQVPALLSEFRDTILAGRPTGSQINMTALLDGTAKPVDNGKSVLLSWGRTSFVSATASAGQVTLTPSGDNVNVSLFNSVKPDSIRYVRWSITASYTRGTSESNTSTGVVDQPLSFTGNNDSFSLRPSTASSFSLPADATDVRYEITMSFFDGDPEQGGKSIPMTAVGDNMTVSSRVDGDTTTYTLSGILQMRGSGVSTASALSELALLPEEERKRGL